LICSYSDGVKRKLIVIDCFSCTGLALRPDVMLSVAGGLLGKAVLLPTL
jgi:hypothetical protein